MSEAAALAKALRRLEVKIEECQDTAADLAAKIKSLSETPPEAGEKAGRDDDGNPFD
jgi:hypothetical protein